MKRSDMVEKLATLLYGANVDLGLMIHNPEYHMADKLLSLVESNGMIPPPYTCINNRDKKPNPFGSCKRYDWESENDV